MKNKLPPRFRIRTWKNRQGEVKTCYYYEHPRDANGKRRLESIGTDQQEALLKWARLEGEKITIPAGSLEELYEKYMQWAQKLHLSKLSVRTLLDREKYWKQLAPVFGHMQLTDIKPEQLLEYFECRSSQVSAKKEIKFLSVMYNWGATYGKCPQINPAAGVTRHMRVDEGRKIYVSDADYRALWNAGDQLLRDFMDITYLCGNRPDETMSLEWSDVGKSEITVRLVKTEKRGARVKRIPIDAELRKILDRIKSRQVVGRWVLVDENGQRLKAQGTLRYRHNEARRKSGVDFQLRDIRPKAATDTAVEHDIEAARILLGHTTQKQTADYIRPMLGEIAAKKPDLVKVKNFQR